MKYWKIGSRWDANGKKEACIVDVFLKNNIAFVKEKNTRGAMMREVKIGDIIAISNGQRIVASAEVISNPNYLNHYPLKLSAAQAQIFDYDYEKDDTVAVKISIRKANLNISYCDGKAFCEIHIATIKNQL